MKIKYLGGNKRASYYKVGSFLHYSVKIEGTIVIMSNIYDIDIWILHI